MIPKTGIFLTFEIEWFTLEIGTVESMISPSEDGAGLGRACRMARPFRAGLSNDPAGLMALIDAERREYLDVQVTLEPQETYHFQVKGGMTSIFS